MHRMPSGQQAGAYALPNTLDSALPGGPTAPAGSDGVAQAILAAALDCVIVIDAGGCVLEWNAAAEETFGYTREEVLGRKLGDLIVPPELRDSHERGLARQLATGESRLLGRRVEMPAMRADGDRLTVELAVTRVPGEPPTYAGYLRDVSERHRREAALQEAAAGRKGLIELAQAALQGRPLAQLMRRGVDLALEHLEPDFCQVWELLAERELLVLRGGFGWKGPEQSISVPTHSKLQPGFVLAHGRPVVVPDFELERRFDQTPLLAGRGVVSGVGVPIPGGSRGLGVMAVHWRESRSITPDEISFLQALATVIGMAIQRRKSEELLKGAEHEYRTLVDRLPVVVYVAEPGGTGSWTYVSPQISNLLGYTPAEWTSDPGLWISRVHPDDRERVSAAEERCARDGEPLEIEYRMHARDGRLVWVRDEGTVRPDGDGAVAIEGLLIDITEERVAHEELRYEANHDHLTGLYNRRRFEHELMSREDGRGAVVVVGVDHLKLVNDSLGPSAGDSVLRGVAKAIEGVLRPDEVLARLGGDEFAVLVPDAQERAARERALAILDAIRSHKTSMPVTASAGVAPFQPGEPMRAEDALMAADIALYQAKEEGRDRVVAFRGREEERLAWVGHLRTAIKEERLVLHSQPIVDVQSGEPVAEELLVRMLGDGDELIPPNSFLPTAERFGLIREIDAWVVRRGLALAATGRPVNINLSARSVADAELPARLGRELTAAGVDPATVVFEITETAAASQVDALEVFAERLQALGCSVALDDFGVGFGSLRYLKYLSPRYLKIDMEFVRGLATSEDDARMVRSIVTMAQGCGILTVAEGVEDAETMAALRSLGVDYAQGFYLGRPTLVRS